MSVVFREGNAGGVSRRRLLKAQRVRSAFLQAAVCGLLLVIPRIGWCESVVIGAFGDYGVASKGEFYAIRERDVAKLVKSWNPDFVITLGDNNYERGEASTIDANVGQFYHEFIYPYTGVFGAGATHNRFFPSLGNHDFFTTGAAPYFDYFTLPGNERYYTYRHGPVQIFCLNSELETDGITNGSVQAKWLEAELSASRATWKLVYFHSPPYTSGAYFPGDTRMRWPFTEWGASAVLAAHDHNYQRIHTNGMVYFVNGIGGADSYPFNSNSNGAVVRYRADAGAMRIEATESNLLFQFVTRSNVLVDTYVIGEPRPGTEIFSHPLSQNVYLGANVEFRTLANGPGTLTYQWYFTGEEIPGATKSVLTLSNVGPENVGDYTVRMRSAEAEVTSNPATLTVIIPPIVAWGCGSRLVPAPTNLVALGPLMGNSPIALRGDGNVVTWTGSGSLLPVPQGVTNVVAVAAGASHFAALRENGTVVCWGGNNFYGQTEVPPGLVDVVAIACGREHTLALRRDGTVAAWGRNDSFQCAVPPDLTNVVAISAGVQSSLALRGDGSLAGWGPIALPGEPVEAIAISSGRYHHLALRRDGTVLAWGPNDFGETNIPPGLTNVIAISAGNGASLALTQSGRVIAWGQDNCQITNLPSYLPTNVTAIACSWQGGLALSHEETPGSFAVEILRRNGGLIELELPTARGWRYMIEYQDTTANGKWQMLPPIPGSGRQKTLQHPFESDGGRIFRVRRTPF